MESLLYSKIKKSELQNELEIREEAKRLSKVEGFKGSKSWFIKFMKRYSLYKKNIEL